MSGRHTNALWIIAIIAASATIGMLVDWRAPGIERYTRDRLMQWRGTLPVPDDIAIVAVDEASIARFGRFPWPRSVAARAVDAIAAAQPRVIALDILYTDPTTPEEDLALARAIGRAGNVVVAAQLVDAPAAGGPATWLLPLAAVAGAAAAVGHVNVSTEAEGIARQLLIRVADDSGRSLRAMAVEAVRIADRTPEQAVTDTPRAVLIGSRVIPIDATAATIVIGGSAERLRASRMTIDYIGPAGSFAPRTYSLAEVIDGRIPAGSLGGKYVLVGATAASMADRVASPFVHQADVRGDQHGALMPGVEVLANALQTILRERFYSPTPDWLAFLLAALVAAVTLGLLEVAQGRHEMVKQVAVLGGTGGGVLVSGYVLFTGFWIFPPLAPGLVSFAAAGILGLLRRSLTTSARLDDAIAEMTQGAAALGLAGGGEPATLPSRLRLRLPRGVEAKAQALTILNQRMLAHARFFDSSFRSVEDGLLIAGEDGRITFVNRRAAGVLGSNEKALLGRDLWERLAEAEGTRSNGTENPLARLPADRAPLEREITIRGTRARRYMLRVAAVTAGDSPSSEVLGIVASLSDITRQHELQQTKNDVMALVSHEMRTPLAAIQGMSELLAQYDLDAGRRREMNLAINEEAKRLTNMITEYLDITRLESGATVLRRSPLRIETLVERSLLLLEPLAGKKSIRLVRIFDTVLPAVLADADLIARAVDNLLSNALKYSPPDTEVTVSIREDHGGVAIAIADQGRGIPAADLERIFEKFYRVPRIEDADTPGTGLGLALVREIAELHGGAVTVVSTVGGGSTFTLRVPRGEEQ